MASNKLFILSAFFICSTIYVYGQSKTVRKGPGDTLSIKFDSLKAVLVTAVLRPRMRGDTLEYNTENIKTRPNAVVEDLLRRLPGLHVDPDGTITYNGEKIQHLLVDGEDIFGDVPTMVTKNFDASKIARVQILDRKSDDAIFTGIDDGSRTKTLNLVLKDSEKNGYFGKLTASGNINGDYTAGGAVAAFQDKEQFTALGLASNIGVLTFSNNGGSFPTDISVLYSNPDPLGTSAGAGIPKAAVSAAHYANTWNGGANHLTMNYQFAHYWTHPITNTESLQTLPDSVYGQQQETQSINTQDQNTIQGTYNWKPNSKSAFRINFHGYFLHFDNQFTAATNSTFNDTLVNNVERTIHDQISRQNLGTDISWRIQTGNSSENVFSVKFGGGVVENVTNGYLYSLERFYESNNESIDTVDQRKQITGHTLTYSGTVNYAFGVWKGTTMGLSYGLSVTGDNPLQATYGPSAGEYKLLIDSLSSNLKTQTLNQRWTINLQGKGRHISYTIGADMLDYDYRQQDFIADSIFRLRYLNVSPRVMLRYNPNPAVRLDFNYNFSTQPPSIEQLAPLINNNNPLYITVGNPSLRPATNQTVGMNFHWLKTWMVGLGIIMTLNNNSISTRTTTDNLGRQVSEPVNTSGGENLSINFSVDHKFGGIDWNFHSSNSYSRTVNYINADLSQNFVYKPWGGIGVTEYVADKYFLQINTDVGYFYSRSSINTSAPVQYWTQSHSALASIYFIPSFDIGTSATYTWQQKTSAFSSSTSALLWNAYVNRSVMHNRLVIGFSISNLLNQNAGISRSNADNVNAETSTNILGRYWLVSATWHFDQKLKRK